jgi:hypothetical protein
LAFSPDGDGSVDALGVDVTWSEDAAWTAKVEDADGTDLDTWSGDGDTASFSWDGLGSGGAALPDGGYQLTVRASDALGNAGASTTRTVTIDTHPPSLDLTGPAADASAGTAGASAAAVGIRTSPARSARNGARYRPTILSGGHSGLPSSSASARAEGFSRRTQPWLAWRA